MAHCFSVEDKVTKGIELTPNDDGLMFVNCGLPPAESVRLTNEWSRQITAAQLKVSAMAERQVNALKEKNASEADIERAKALLRTVRYRDPIIDKADFDGDGFLTRKLSPKHRGDALVHLCTTPGNGGELTWVASTYSEFLNDRGRVDRKYHALSEAVGVSLVSDGELAKLVAMKPHASIRFERSGDTDGGDLRVMLKWIPPVLHWRTLQPAQTRKG